MAKRTMTAISAIGAIGLVSLLLTSGSAAFSASAPAVSICSGGSFTSGPQVLSGTYNTLVVTGFCAVGPAGPVHVTGSLTVGSGAALSATAGASLTVDGNLTIATNAIVALGCGGNDGGPCDDGAAIGTPFIGGSVIAVSALAIIVHNATINGNVTQAGGGGGSNCNPGPGPLSFAVFSAWEDSQIGGNVSVVGVKSCWMGIVRNSVGGSVAVTGNNLADPDAIEILGNMVAHNLSCVGNSMVWDSSEAGDGLFPRNPDPNTVNGLRSGQCVLSSPVTPGGPSGPGPF